MHVFSIWVMKLGLRYLPLALMWTSEVNVPYILSGTSILLRLEFIHPV